MKSQRQAKIMEIISTQNVETQDQLLRELEAAGFPTTQATISRDIRKLGLVKEQTGFGRSHYVASVRELPKDGSDRLNGIFRQCVTSFDYAENILVIHTMPGLANAAGSALDSMHVNALLGTLAGGDTVIAVLRDANAAAALYGEIKLLMDS